MEVSKSKIDFIRLKTFIYYFFETEGIFASQYSYGCNSDNDDDGDD